MSDKFTVTVRQEEDYRFTVDFDQPGVPDLRVDEPPPLGGGAGPNPARLLAAAVANCLSASLLFCMRKARIEPSSITATVEGTLERNERGRLRIGALRVKVHPTLDEADAAKAGRCMGLFEDFCLVTESVRDGIDIDVEVEPLTVDGYELAEPAAAGTGTHPGGPQG